MEKKSLPILLSISAFSILFSFSFSFLPINDFSSQIRSYITDRNYIFLICNGILVFIIKSSGFTSDPSLNSVRDNDSYIDKYTQTLSKPESGEKRADQVQTVAELFKKNGAYKEEVVAELVEKKGAYKEEVVAELVEKNGAYKEDGVAEFVEKKGAYKEEVVAELVEKKGAYKEEVVVESEEEQVRVYESLGEEQEEDEYVYECEDEDDFFIIEDDEFGELSTEELNKKCDEFIRKMREGINIQVW